MTDCSLESSVPDWILDHPETWSVFQELGIDCSCGGRSLEFACRDQGLDAQAVLVRLRRTIDVRQAANSGRAADGQSADPKET